MNLFVVSITTEVFLTVFTVFTVFPARKKQLMYSCSSVAFTNNTVLFGKKSACNHKKCCRCHKITQLFGTSVDWTVV